MIAWFDIVALLIIFGVTSLFYVSFLGINFSIAIIRSSRFRYIARSFIILQLINSGLLPMSMVTWINEDQLSQYLNEISLVGLNEFIKGVNTNF